MESLVPAAEREHRHSFPEPALPGSSLDFSAWCGEGTLLEASFGPDNRELTRGAKRQWPLWNIFCHHEDQKAVMVFLLPSVAGDVEQGKLSSGKGLHLGIWGRGFGNHSL